MKRLVLKIDKTTKAVAVLILIFIAVALVFRINDYFVAKRKAEEEEKRLAAIRTKLEYRTGAVETAKDFIKLPDKEELRQKYDIEPVKLDNFPHFWNVWFEAKDKKKKPDKGLLQIHKKTGKAEWRIVQ